MPRMVMPGTGVVVEASDDALAHLEAAGWTAEKKSEPAKKAPAKSAAKSEK